MSGRAALREARAALDAALHQLEGCKSALSRSQAFAASRAAEIAKMDAVVLSLTEAVAGSIRAFANGHADEPGLNLPDELMRAHRAREDAQCAFDLARGTVEELERELAVAESAKVEAQEAVEAAALKVLVAEAERRADEITKAQAIVDAQRGRLTQLVALFRLRNVLVPPSVGSVFLPRADLRTGGSLVITAGPWSSTFDELVTNPDAAIDVPCEPVPAAAPQRPSAGVTVISHRASRPLPVADSETSSEPPSSSLGDPVEAA
jgi:hypothetical protein